MLIIECIERAFRQGCGRTLEDALRTKRFQELAEAQRTIFKRYPPESDEGIALLAGHLAMGELLNTRPEREALCVAKSRTTRFGMGIELRAVIQFLGECLVDAATRCLPPLAHALAAEWRDATADRQIAITRELFHVFRSKKQESKGDLTVDKVFTRFVNRLHDLNDERGFLPGIYGAWDAHNCPANCQGKTQLLTAFAHLAHTRVLCACPIRQGRTELDRLRSQMRDVVVCDLAERRLLNADPAFKEGIRASYLEDALGEEDFFHIGSALELRDGRWVLIDPHGLAWGVFPQEWDMPETHRLLQKYGEALPGIELILDDQGCCAKRLSERRVEVEEMLERSRNMERRIREAGIRNIADFVEVVGQSDDLDALLKCHLESEGGFFPEISDPISRRYVAMMLVVGGEKTLGNFFAMLEPGFFEARLKSWLTFYHATALNLLREQLTEEGKLLHPVCGFSQAEYRLAFSAINSLACRQGDWDSTTAQFFLDYSFDQTALHNVLGQLMRGGDWTLGRTAAETLMALPYKHGLCEQRLRNFADRVR